MTFLASDMPMTGDTKCITVTIIDDDDYEGTHQFMIGLTLSSPAMLMGGSHTIEIQENDGMITEWVCIVL